MSDKDILKEAKEAFKLAVEAESENREMWLEDFRFGRLGEQWPSDIAAARRAERRPTLTINRMPSFIRQIVNDSRQNKPQIKVKPVDDHADTATADMLSGLIRNIEQSSNADVAYDTAIDHAVSGGFGYIRVDVEYSYDDSFDKHLVIKRVANPLMVYGDPYSTEADSSDWNTAFVVDFMTKAEFKKRFPDAAETDWEAADNQLDALWHQDGNVLIAEWFRREKYKKNLLQLANGMAVAEDVYKANQEVLGGIPVINSRPIDCYKIKHHLLSGAEELEKDTEWAGKYIPIIPVYGEEINIEGKRHFRSLIRDAKDAQRMLNYWRTTATELVALAPRVPFMMEEGALNIDPEEAAKWSTANAVSHARLLYKDGKTPPIRLPLDSGTAAGAMTEALTAADDMKSIMGMFDASLGQKSNETSGKAIMARQREGDVSTFHFIDNLSRAIRHTGCVLVDMIPKVYTGERIVRTLGEDGKPANAKLGSMPEGMPKPPDPAPGSPPDMSRIYDISVGRYDVAVSTGPGFTTRREESTLAMTEMIRAFPAAAPVIGPYLVKSMDLPDAEAISADLEKLSPANGPAIPPELQQQIDEGMKRLQELEQENQTLKMDAQNKALELQIKEQELQIKQFEAETERMQLGQQAEIQQAELGNAEAERTFKREENDRANGGTAKTVAQEVVETVTPTIAQVVSQSVVDAMQNVGPLPVKMPKMRRTPVRDKSGLILHTVDEPIEDEAPAPEMVN